MVAKYKLSTQDYDQDCLLFAIHTSIKDYTLAYLLNKKLNTRFERLRTDLELQQKAVVSVFGWDDEKEMCYWSLVSNKAIVEEEAQDNDLFANLSIRSKEYLIPELKEVDYFIKIEDDHDISEVELIKKIKSIAEVQTVYQVEYSALKSKHNLIY